MAATASVVRVALLLALAALAALLAWIGGMGMIEGAPGRGIVLGLALAPAVALFVRLTRGRLGSLFAVPVAIVSAIVGMLLSFCLCYSPMSTETVVVLVASAIVGGLAVIDMVIGGGSQRSAAGEGGMPGA